MKTRRIHSWMIWGAVLVLIMTSCSVLPGQATPTPQPEPLEVFNPVVSATGVVVPLQWARLSLPGSGVVEELAVSEDEAVEAGQMLIRLQGEEQLEAAIAALRPHVNGRLITVFGAGGDRDQGKRAPMGEAAARYSDSVIVTDDNPRGEDPAVIRAAVLEGARAAAGDTPVFEIGDRREAIRAAIRDAGPQDIVLVAGKGHEVGQVIGSGESMKVLPFDDVAVARECAAGDTA